MCASPLSISTLSPFTSLLLMSFFVASSDLTSAQGMQRRWGALSGGFIRRALPVTGLGSGCVRVHRDGCALLAMMTSQASLYLLRAIAQFPSHSPGASQPPPCLMRIERVSQSPQQGDRIGGGEHRGTDV
jgi:hypothetical protein